MSSATTQTIFATEEMGLEYFDSVIATVPDSFRLYREVEGCYTQPRAFTEEKRCRIDRLLIPVGKLANEWQHGAIGIEAKKGEHKIGLLVNQAIDYTRCTFEIPIPKGMWIVPQWIFIYPFENPKGEFESIMASNRIGYVRVDREGLSFFGSATCGLRIANGIITTKYLPMGNKRGSR